MKLEATSILLAAFCCLTLSSSGCTLRPNRASAKAPVAAPKPAVAPPPAQPADELPISVTQTRAVLPKPQPIEAAALASTVPETPAAPEPATQTVTPPRAPRPEPRPNAAIPQQATPPAAPAGPPVARRLRPVESPAERQKLLAGISARQKQVADILSKARSRQLSEKDKNSVDRIQAFLEQAEAALKDEDLQQAEALSSRALLLCQDLSGEK